MPLSQESSQEPVIISHDTNLADAPFIPGHELRDKFASVLYGDWDLSLHFDDEEEEALELTL